MDGLRTSTPAAAAAQHQQSAVQAVRVSVPVNPAWPEELAAAVGAQLGAVSTPSGAYLQPWPRPQGVSAVQLASPTHVPLQPALAALRPAPVYAKGTSVSAVTVICGSLHCFCT